MVGKALVSSRSIDEMRAAVGDVALITDHSSEEGNQLPLSTAMQGVLGVTPILIDARDFMIGGTGEAKLVDGSLTLEVPAKNLVVTPSLVLIYEIPPVERQRFERFQRRLRQLGVVCLGSEVEAWRNATQKDRTVQCFLRDGIPHMETITLRRPNLPLTASAFRRLGQDVWTRPTMGMEGDHVFHVTTYEQLQHVRCHYDDAGLDWQMSRDAENFDAEGKRHDFRVIVLQGRALVASERGQLDPDKPCNHAKGGTCRRLSVQDLPRDFVQLAIVATRSLGLAFGGVDLSLEKRVVFEVNVHPALFPTGYMEAVAVPLVEAHVAQLEERGSAHGSGRYLHQHSAGT